MKATNVEGKTKDAGYIESSTNDCQSAPPMRRTSMVLLCQLLLYLVLFNSILTVYTDWLASNTIQQRDSTPFGSQRVAPPLQLQHVVQTTSSHRLQNKPTQPNPNRNKTNRTGMNPTETNPRAGNARQGRATEPRRGENRPTDRPTYLPTSTDRPSQTLPTK